jgi:hypothetical protein
VSQTVDWAKGYEHWTFTAPLNDKWCPNHPIRLALDASKYKGGAFFVGESQGDGFCGARVVANDLMICNHLLLKLEPNNQAFAHIPLALREGEPRVFVALVANLMALITIATDIDSSKFEALEWPYPGKEIMRSLRSLFLDQVFLTYRVEARSGGSGALGQFFDFQRCHSTNWTIIHIILVSICMKINFHVDGLPSAYGSNNCTRSILEGFLMNIEAPLTAQTTKDAVQHLLRVMKDLPTILKQMSAGIHLVHTSLKQGAGEKNHWSPLFSGFIATIFNKAPLQAGQRELSNGKFQSYNFSLLSPLIASEIFRQSNIQQEWTTYQAELKTAKTVQRSVQPPVRDKTNKVELAALYIEGAYPVVTDLSRPSSTDAGAPYYLVRVALGSPSVTVMPITKNVSSICTVNGSAGAKITVSIAKNRVEAMAIPRITEAKHFPSGSLMCCIEIEVTPGVTTMRRSLRQTKKTKYIVLVACFGGERCLMFQPAPRVSPRMTYASVRTQESTIWSVLMHKLSDSQISSLVFDFLDERKYSESEVQWIWRSKVSFSLHDPPLITTGDAIVKSPREFVTRESFLKLFRSTSSESHVRVTLFFFSRTLPLLCCLLSLFILDLISLSYVIHPVIY